MQSFSSVSSAGVVSYLPRVDVTVDVSKVIGVNNLSLGFQLDFEWKKWRDSAVRRQLAGDVGFKLVRIFDWRSQSGASPDPCVYWNETTRSGVFNWADVDLLVTRIFEVGAEPLITLGGYDMQPKYLPNGMATNPATGLPYSDSWAAYCEAWVQHFKDVGLPVRFYEIVNEAWTYYGWNNYTRIGYFMSLFNTATNAMKSVSSKVMVGFDGANRKPVLDYWLANGGAELDFISFHKYDSGTIGEYSDEVMLNRAENFQIETSSGYYGIQDVQRVYFNARGKWVLVINSESNFSSAWETGTDPKIQQMVGAVWEALVLRKGILEGLNYNVYYSFSSSASWEKANKQSGGVGFGMINDDDNKPWYPYHVQWMIGNNLSVGDQIVEANSSSDNLKALAWINEGKLKILLICKSNEPLLVYFQGITEVLTLIRIDSTIPWETPVLQVNQINSTEALVLQGYTVALLSISY
ncbi:MAG: GH39 family glycosyl hydrolase [Candidatus Bathyarchaeia archaeon]|nr:hypothetical protein [Candidatus Bathyarchaeota archaeon A05DMB-4]